MRTPRFSPGQLVSFLRRDGFLAECFGKPGFILTVACFDSDDEIYHVLCEDKKYLVFKEEIEECDKI